MRIFVTSATGWRLLVSDNGVGRTIGVAEVKRVGLGTSIVEALARQLNARVEIYDEYPGMQISITHDAAEKEVGIFTLVGS